MKTGKRHFRVLILSKTFEGEGGVVNFVSNLIKHSSSTIHFQHLAIGTKRSPFGIFQNFVTPIIDNYSIALLLLRTRPDCIHVNPSFNFKSLIRDGLFIVTCSLFSASPKIVFFHGWNASHENTIKKNWLMQLVLREIFGRASTILVLSSTFKSSLVQLGFKPDQIQIFTTMFDGKIFEGVVPEKNKSEKKIVFLSRFVKEKGLFEVLGAFQALVKRFPNLKLIMAGDGPEREPMMQWVLQSGLQDSISFPGYLRGVSKAQVLVDGDIFAFPTYYGEGCPVSLLEAMAAGLAVVTSDVGGIPDIFDDGKNGILVKTIGWKNVEAAIEQLLIDDDFLACVQNVNKEKAWKNFEASVVTARMESVYTEVQQGKFF